MADSSALPSQFRWHHQRGVTYRVLTFSLDSMVWPCIQPGLDRLSAVSKSGGSVRRPLGLRKSAWSELLHRHAEVVNKRFDYTMEQGIQNAILCSRPSPLKPKINRGLTLRLAQPTVLDLRNRNDQQFVRYRS